MASRNCLFFASIFGLATSSAAAALQPQAVAAAEIRPWNAGEIVALKNGYWFDGTRFVTRDVVYLVNGRFADIAPGAVHREVDLSGKYVVPPIADGHTHGFDGPGGLPRQREQYLADGVFYAMTMTAPSDSVAKIRDQLKGPKNVDVASAMGGITGPNSHPAEIYEAYPLGYYTYQQQLKHAWEIRQSRKMADNAYYVVESPADVDAKWNIIRKYNPDFIKVFLRTSERYEEDWKKWGAGGGIDPKLLPYIVQKARTVGWRTAVATSSLFDFRQAVASGAAIVSHPPCYQEASDPGPYFDIDEPENCLLEDADARQAAARGLATIAIVTEWSKARPTEMVEWEQSNLGRLAKAGAPIGIGSNQYGSTPVEGIISGASKGLYPAADILRWATMTTPRIIFPDRQVGCLRTGCEASFLVLGANPLADMTAIRQIELRVKEGEPLLQAQYQHRKG